MESKATFATTGLRECITDEQSFLKNRKKLQDEIRLIKLIGNYILEGDEEPDFTPQPVQGNAMNKALAEQHNKEVGENRKVWNQNKGSVFGQILLYLSRNSCQTIQEVEDWEQIEKDQNPVTLQRIIEETLVEMNKSKKIYYPLIFHKSKRLSKTLMSLIKIILVDSILSQKKQITFKQLMINSSLELSFEV